MTINASKPSRSVVDAPKLTAQSIGQHCVLHSWNSDRLGHPCSTRKHRQTEARARQRWLLLRVYRAAHAAFPIGCCFSSLPPSLQRTCLSSARWRRDHRSVSGLRASTARLGAGGELREAAHDAVHWAAASVAVEGLGQGGAELAVAFGVDEDLRAETEAGNATNKEKQSGRLSIIDSLLCLCVSPCDLASRRARHLSFASAHLSRSGLRSDSAGRVAGSKGAPLADNAVCVESQGGAAAAAISITENPLDICHVVLRASLRFPALPTAQQPSLHCCDSESGGHAVPPHSGATVCVRNRKLSPSPQVAEHAPNADQADTSQFTGQQLVLQETESERAGQLGYDDWKGKKKRQRSDKEVKARQMSDREANTKNR